MTRELLLGTLVLLGGVCPGLAGTHLEFLPPLWHDTSGNPAADPENPRVMGPGVLHWGDAYLVYSDGNELRRRTIRGDGSLGPYSLSHFDVPPPSDADYILFNWSLCDACRFGIAGYNSQGTVLWDSGTGASPLFGDHRRYQDAGTLGGLTFLYGGREYVVSRVPAGCQGWSVAEITGLETSNLRVVQCVTDAAGQPISVDAGFWLPRAPVIGDPLTGHVWLLDSSLRRVHAYTVRTVAGDPWLDAIGWAINAVWIRARGIDLDLERRIAVSAYSTGMQVWDITDPVAPVLLSTTPLPLAIPAMAVALRWPYVYVGTMHTVDTGSGHLFDITHPTAPVELDPGFWTAFPPPCVQGSVVPPASAHPWNDYPCASNKGGVWWGDNLYLARYSVGERFLLHTGADPELVFADGFDDGTTAAWSAAQP